MEEDDPASYGREPTERQKPHAAAPPDHTSHRNDSGDKNHQAYEQAYWIVTGGASVLATIATGVAAWYAVGAYNASWQAVRASRDQTEIAKGALIASNRPWVKVDDVTVTRIEIASPAGQFYLRIKGTNVGHSPAQRVSLSFRFLLPEIDLPNPSFANPTSAMVKTCEQGKRNHANSVAGPETVIFPGDSKIVGFAQPENIEPVPAERMETARQALARRIGRTEIMSRPYRSRLILVGCISYSSQDPSQPYQTSFAFDVWQRSPGGKPGSEGPIDLTTPRVISEDQLITIESRWSNIVE